jgi:hypothetical protein
VFTIFSTDEATFANAQIWKNLLRRTCVAGLSSFRHLPTAPPFDKPRQTPFV